MDNSYCCADERHSAALRQLYTFMQQSHLIYLESAVSLCKIIQGHLIKCPYSTAVRSNMALRKCGHL
ncbi:MAG: hypothetical protein SWX82_33640 [Cyanobacteriota bacterium]|nr:hypothetical protein [Cyanobacteriota bacterium]